MSDDTKEVKLRLPLPLHERLRLAAERDHRSMNAQAIIYVERGLDTEDRKERRGTR